MLDWSIFESLPGADTENFEILCRSIVLRQFGSLGPLRELKNQPGVEFHIQLNRDDSRLGNISQIVGWQCKWFQYRADGALTSSARTQIEHSLKKTLQHLPELDIWILWTHKTFSKVDQDWYYELEKKYGFKLHLWNQNHLDHFLSGPAIDLRTSYFGELALTPEMLADQHEKSVAPIQKRWIHGVHQEIEFEHTIRQILGELNAWEDSEQTHQFLSETILSLNFEIDQPQYKEFRLELETFRIVCRNFESFYAIFQKPIDGQNYSDIVELGQVARVFSSTSIRRVLSKLRRQNLPLSIIITNALAYIEDTKTLLEHVNDRLSRRLVAVIADAGGGKTQFAAEITAMSENRPAGVLLLGRSLKAGCDLDSLANQIKFYNKPVESFEALIAALDAAGTRAGCRLPIVIDGLNEAQDPREWKPLLETALKTLCKYQNVVLICTLRTDERSLSDNTHRHKQKNKATSREGFAHQSLPDDIYTIKSNGFNSDITIKAIRAYFKHYKISADPFSAPLDFFSHPLNLRIFCEVMNRNALTIVQVKFFPSTIYSLFKEQIQHSAITISEMSNLTRRYRIEDIQQAVYYFGERIWDEGTRSISEDRFREITKSPLGNWEDDLVNLLAQEGLLFRDVGDQPFNYKLTPVYDRLGGFLVANYLLQKNATSHTGNWVSEKNFIEKIFGTLNTQHELAEDILFALIALTPKFFSQQHLWQALPQEYSAKALSLSHLIDLEDFSDQTLDAYTQQIISEKISTQTFEQLRILRGVVGHPLNADFQCEILKQLSLVERDLSWTEYNRHFYHDRISEVERLISHWSSPDWHSAEVERLRAVLTSWLLTSTNNDLRDLATQALLHYGLRAPSQLFKITIELLSINDPYISERLLAVSYGVVATLLPKSEAQEEISQFVRNLYEAMFAITARAATTHIISRNYASCIIQAVFKFKPGIVSEEQLAAATHPFSLMPRMKWDVDLKDQRLSRDESPFRMDFENYTIGRLVPSRRNYDYENMEYKNIRGQILWRIKHLGWDGKLFSKVDEYIEEDSGFSKRNRVKIERYGKKYSWIAYYEISGQLMDKGKLEHYEDRFVADIDPFFPTISPPRPLHNSDFLQNSAITTEEWITNNTAPNFDNITVANELDIHDGQWVLLNGYIVEEDKKTDRHFDYSVTALFCSPSDTVKIQEHFKTETSTSWPEITQIGYSYSGEIYGGWNFEIGEYKSLEISSGFSRKEIVRDEIRINGEIAVEGGRQLRDIPTFTSFKVKSPVISYYWDYSSNSLSNIDQIILSPWVVQLLDLQFNPTTFEYTDSAENLAAFFLEQKSEVASNHRRLFYLRKDLAEVILKKTGLKLVWKTWGERRYARVETLQSKEVKSMKYKNFELVDVFTEGKPTQNTH